MGKQKILSIVLCLALLLSLMPMAVYADETTETEPNIIIVGYKEPIADDRVADYLDIKAYGKELEEESSDYTVSKIVWKNGSNAHLTGTDRFTANENYTCIITLTPKESVMVDLMAMKVGFYTCGQILSVSPVKGKNQDGTIDLTIWATVKDTQSYSITFKNKTDASGGSAMLCDHSATYAPKAGQEVFVFCNTGYVFSEVSPSGLKWEPVNKWGMDGFHFLMPDSDVAFTIVQDETQQEIVIPSVAITLVNKADYNTAAAPLAGKKISDYTVRYDAGEYDNEVALGACYWVTTGQNADILSDTETFVEGEKYKLVIEIKPDEEGYIFDNTTSFTVNGEKIETPIVGKISAQVQKNFTAVADVDAHDLPTGWTQDWTVGGDLDANSTAYPTGWLNVDESENGLWSDKSKGWSISATGGRHDGEAAFFGGIGSNSKDAQNTTIWTQATTIAADKEYMLTFMGINFVSAAGENAKILLSTDDGKTSTELTSAEYTAQDSKQIKHGKLWTKYTIPLSGEDYAGKNVRIGIKKLATTTPVTVDCFYMYSKDSSIDSLALTTAGYKDGGNIADFTVTADNVTIAKKEIYADGKLVPENDTFSYEKSYRVFLYIDADKYNMFGLDIGDITADGNSISEIGSLAHDRTNNQFIIEFDLPRLKQALKEVKITFDESAFKYGAVYGEVLENFNIKISPELNFTPHFEIYEKGEPRDRYYDRESSYFFPYYKSFYLKDGYDYYLFLEIHYDGYDVSGLKKENITFNGKPVYMAFNSKAYKTIQPYYKLSPAPLTKPENQTIIDKITISGISAPYVGEHPQTDGARVSEGEVLIRDFNNDGNIDWFEVGGSGNGKIYKAMDANDTFELGKTYACRVSVSPKNGTYAFKTVAENGESLPGAKMSIITTDGKTRQAEAMPYSAATQVWSEQEQDYIQGDDIDYGYDEQLWLLSEFVCTKKPQQSSGGGGGGVTNDNYTVTLNKTDGGTLSASHTTTSAGTTITITATPQAGYELSSITAATSGESLKLTKNGNKYTFIMPAGDVKVQANFAQKDVKPSTKQTIIMTIGQKSMTADGKSIMLDAAPVIMNNRTYVPIRAITESLGGSAEWNAKERSVTLKIDEQMITLKIGTVLEKYGAAPLIIDNRTYVPIRFVAEELGASVVWDGQTRTVTIEK